MTDTWNRWKMNAKITKFSIIRLVELGIGVGGRASSCARNVSKVMLTHRVIYWRWRSLDLTPLDFYYWGYVKQTIYSVRIHNIQHLKQRIREVAASVTPDALGRVWQEMEYHLDVYRATNGAHIELR
jgi:hypothetical protein